MPKHTDLPSGNSSRVVQHDTLDRLSASSLAPQITWALTRAIADEVQRQGGADLTLAGSLAQGAGDAVSDIDLEAHCDDESARSRLIQAVDALLRQQGRLLAAFPATHIGMPHLLIRFVEVDCQVLKVDVHYLVKTMPGAPVDGCMLVREGRAACAPVQAMPVPAQSVPNELEFFEDLHNKFCGWIWYAHTKIVRGEYWEAEDAIAVMRTRALLPVLARVRGLPAEGCRRLEVRLPDTDRAALSRTRSADLNPDALRAALQASIDMLTTLMPALRDRLGDGFRESQFDRMSELSGYVARRAIVNE